MAHSIGTPMAIGDRVYLYGGRVGTSNYVGLFNGGVYNILTDQWEAVPSFNAQTPAPWFSEPGIWTGAHFLFRGGDGGGATQDASGDTFVASGGMYSVDQDQWVGGPNFRNGTGLPKKSRQSVAWTGEHYLEFAGEQRLPIAISPSVTVFIRPTNDGLCYDPALDSYLQRPALQYPSLAPAMRREHGFAWTGAQFVVWGGLALKRVIDPVTLQTVQDHLGDGWGYDEVRDEWTQLSGLSDPIAAPSLRSQFAHIWTGDRMVIWGGREGPIGEGSVPVNTGGIYVPPRVAPTIRSGQVGVALQANTFFRHRVTVYGCPRATVGVMGMPSWMTQKWLDTGCFLEGTPNAAEALQSSTITITADNGIGTFAMQTIMVGPPAPAFIDPIPNLNAEVGPRFEYRIPAGGPPYPTLSAIGMPSWMSIVSGRIEGYPTQADVNQVSTITVTADNGVGVPATRTFSVTVVPGSSPPLLTTPTSLSTTAAEPFSMLLTATGNPTPVFSLQNSPAWLGLNGDVLAGTPPASLSGQTINITLQASNNVPPAATATLALTILHHPTDVTRDAAIDVVDVQRVVNLILALGVEAYPGEGDANGDTVVDVVDVQAVVNKILSP